MDIKQAMNAVAAVTLSKDMTLRDLKQGSWRMRQIGRGQTVQIIIVREVAKLILETTKTKEISLLGICTWYVLIFFLCLLASFWFSSYFALLPSPTFLCIS
jgi:hypothetical protein